MSNYDELIKEVRKMKSRIDEIIKTDGITNKLLEYENPLNKVFNKINKFQLKSQDEMFILFNFYSAKSYIHLAKGWKFKAFNSFITALKFYLKYVGNLADQTKWNNLNYYFVLKNYILDRKIELFGNTKDNTFNDLVSCLKALIYTIQKVTLNVDIRNSVYDLIIETLFSTVSQSSELYSESHLKRSERIIELMKLFDSKNISDCQKGVLKSIEFVLLKRRLHFYLRKLVPSKLSVTSDIASIREEIKSLLKEMEETSNSELKLLRKSIRKNKKTEFRIFLAELDKYSVEYYKNLWLFSDFIKAFKSLEKIFTHIRKNITLLKTSKIFSHFTLEYEMLVIYYKFYLLIKEFKDFGNRKDILSWQKETSLKVANNLQNIITNYYKYRIPQGLERKLLIVERTTSGKFIEFIVLYLLKEFIEKDVELTKYLQQEHDGNIKDLFGVLTKVKHRSEIKWGYKIEGIESDIDILMEISATEKYGLFIKSGVLNNNDLKKIRQEIAVAEQIKLNKTFIVVDIAKNSRVIHKIGGIKQGKRIILVDIGDLLRILLKIVKREKKVEFELSQSGVLTYAGLYS